LGVPSMLVQPAIAATPTERTRILLAFLMSASKRFFGCDRFLAH
jgi:hypothetical protein